MSIEIEYLLCFLAGAVTSLVLFLIGLKIGLRLAGRPHRLFTNPPRLNPQAGQKMKVK